MDWWMYSAKSLALKNRSDTVRVKCLFFEGAQCQLLVVKTVSTVWANLLLKCHDAVLGKLKDNMSFESFMDLCSVLESGSAELFPQEALERALEKSSCVFHDEAIREVVTIDKLLRKPTKRLQFSHAACQAQSTTPSGPQSPRPASDKGTPASLFGPKTPFSSRYRMGRSLKVSCCSLSHRWEVFQGSIGVHGIPMGWKTGQWRFSTKGTSFHHLPLVLRKLH